MPLIQGCSVMVVRHNFNILVDEGYSRKQALAICFSIARNNIYDCGIKRRKAIVQGRLFSYE